MDLIDHDQGACVKASSHPTTMVQSTIYCNYTTVYDGGNIVANEVDLVICVVVCHVYNADFCWTVVGMTVTASASL